MSHLAAPLHVGGPAIAGAIGEWLTALTGVALFAAVAVFLAFRDDGSDAGAASEPDGGSDRHGGPSGESKDP